MESLKSHESVQKITTAPSAIESLIHPTGHLSVWPDKISHNPELIKQAGLRREVRKSLDIVFGAVPNADMNISRAIDLHILDPKETANMYRKLSDLLTTDNTERLVLYIPFEIIPGKDWQASTPELAEVISEFKTTYMIQWRKMLNIQDVRANFVNGDVLEYESRINPHPRVVKAAHMIPKLIEKGLISIPEVISLLQQNSDQIFRESIQDALAVLDDIGLLSNEQQEFNKSHVATDETKETTLPITDNRASWLEKERERKTIEESAEKLSVQIQNHTISLEELKTNTLAISPVQNTLIGIHGIRKAIESASKNSMTQAQGMQNTYQSLFVDLWNKNNPVVQDALISTWSRWINLGVIESTYVEQFKIILPKLDGTFSENKNRMGADMESGQDIAKIIKSDPLLLKHLYPVVLLYGSRIKGYNTQTSDRDLAMFVKPNTSEEELLVVRQKMIDIAGGKLFEFTVAENEGGLYIADHKDATYILFQSVWTGDAETIRELHEKILSPYLHTDENRKPWLEEIERSIIQYRLMHRGYAHFFPPQGGIKTEHSDSIDSNSMFWDSGFRRMATKLFVDKVFLPHLEK